MQKVATKDPDTFTKTQDKATKVHELTKGTQENDFAHAIATPTEDCINQNRGDGSQNPYHGSYRSNRGGGHGAPRGGQPGWGGSNNGGEPKPSV